jgi:hypothetical protein
MATWLTHLRVAERLSDQINITDRSLFFAGSIAPDSDTLSDILHWCTNADKTTCDAQGFYIGYISGSLHTEDKNLDFYWGYYIHLLIDILWHRQKIAPLKHENKDTIRAIKQKWRNVDISFLSDNRNFKPLTEMKYAMECTGKYDKQWLDYYTAGQIKKLVGGILSNLDITEAAIQSRDAIMETEIEQFINECEEFIALKLKEVRNEEFIIHMRP